MQRIRRARLQQAAVLPARSPLNLIVTDAPASCPRVTAAPRRREAQAVLLLATAPEFAVATRTHRDGGTTALGQSWLCPHRRALTVALAMSLFSGAAFAACTTAGTAVTCASGSTTNHFARVGDVRTTVPAGTVFSTPPQLGGNGRQAFGTAIGNAVIIPDGEFLTIGGPADGTFSDSISGAGSVIKEGTGTETMTGTNTYTGGTLINAGTLAIGAGGSLAATGTMTLAAPGTGFDISAGGAQSIGVLDGVAGSTLSLGGNTLTLGGVRNGTFDGVITGTGGLVKNGSGIQELGGASTFSGGLALNAGGLVLGNNGALGTGSLSVGGNATLDTAAPLILASAINLAADTQLDFLGSHALTLSGAITGAGGLIKDGTSTLTLTGSNSYTGDTTINAGTLAIGAGGSVASTGAVNLAGNGVLDISAGGTVSNQDGVIGNAGGSVGKATVTGSGSTWTNKGVLTVGKEGQGLLQILDGGLVESASGSINSGTLPDGGVEVVGSGSTWTNAGGLLVGETRLGSMEVLAGGLVKSASVSLGASTGSEGRVRVNGFDAGGVNSRLGITGDLLVGDAGTGELLVDNAGVLDNANGTIGNTADSTDSRALVTGTGSAWTNRETLSIGKGGEGILEVLDGGHVQSTSGSIGTANGSDGKVRVSGIGSADTHSSWTNSENLAVGNAGTGTLLVEAGGLVESSEASIGNASGSGGSVTVEGAGSVWTNSGEMLYVGSAGSGVLNVLDGGVVSDVNGRVGGTSESRGEVSVSGAGAHWVNSGQLQIGVAGAGTLGIRDGGQVSDVGGFIGVYAGSTGEVAVTGAGSSWVHSEQALVGYEGAGTLSVQDGGQVSGPYGFIGVHSGSVGEAVVAGPGSGWSNSVCLFVGYEGSGTLTVRDGGAVSDGGGLIGEFAGSRGKVTVTGAGSSWIHAGELFVGEQGAAELTVEDGALVKIQAAGGDAALAGFDGSAGILNIGAGGAAGLLDVATVTGGEGNATLNFNHDEADYAFTNDGTAGGRAVLIGGTTTVNQIGTGTTVLTGAHTYTGATHVNAGTLLVDGSLGKTATTVSDGGTLGGSGSIGGAVTIADGGTLAPGSSAGTLTVNSLLLSSGSVLDYELGRADVIGHGVNDLVDVKGNLTLDGTLDITDIGGFGVGVYRLMNYGGDLTDKGLEIGTRPTGVDANDLFVQTTTSGQVNLVNSAGLTLSFWDGSVANEHNNDTIDDGDGVWNAGNDNWTASDGTLNGRWHDGTFAVFGGTAGTVDVVGEQAIAGLQFMSGYTLAAGANGALSIDGAESVIRVDPDVTATIAAPIIGTGGLVKTDTGTLVLSGANTYTGSTRIDRGTLSLDGTLGGSTRVTHGATLIGTGTLHDVDNHGTVAPGHSIGTLTLTGDYVHHAEATLQAEIAPDGGSDRLDIAGTATLEGGTVDIVKLPGQYAGGTRYILLDAQGGVTGTFATLEQDLPFLDLQLGYDAHHAYLDVQRNDVGFDIACGDGTFNQCQVAGALDRVADAPAISDDLKATLAEVSTMDLPNAKAAFDRLSGEAHGSLAGILLEDQALQGQTVSRRLAERRDQSGADRLFGGGWARIYGANSNLDGDGNAHGADVEQRGMALGFDTWSNEQWLVGISVHAMSTTADFRPGDSGTADTTGASLYASFDGDDAYLDATAGFASWRNDVTRRIAVGSIDRTAHSEYGGHQFATRLEGGWTFHVGERQRLQPLLGVEYATVDQGSFREHGAQDLDLIGRAQDVERTTASAGLRWSAAFGHGAWTWEPTVQARWLHAFGDEQAEQEVAFAGAPEIGYRVRGVSWPQDRGLLGVGLHIRQGDTVDLFVDVDYQKGGALATKNLGAGLRWHW